MPGDTLASGGVRAQFNPATNISDEKFKEMFGEEALRKLNIISEEDRKKLEQEAVAEVEKLAPSISASVKFRAVQDRIIVRRIEEDEKTDGGIIVPDEGREKPAEGIVIAVGPGKWIDGELQRPSISVGERVVFGKFSGAEVKLGFEKYLVLREEDLFLVRES